ncbi:hypothetical protein MTP04_24430 [Lysinibacillus sp. PLM2]|nr:hypothetical protein MTP04_24430 [Lysinibacillus sp. PLM2]
MAYKVVNEFKDKDDNKTLYRVGEGYPKGNYQPTEERIAELLAVHPKYKRVFIEKVEIDEEKAEREAKEAEEKEFAEQKAKEEAEAKAKAEEEAKAKAEAEQKAEEEAKVAKGKTTKTEK